MKEGLPGKVYTVSLHREWLTNPDFIAERNKVHPLQLSHLTKMCSGSEAGSYLRLIDSCITQLKAHGPSRTCNESKEEEEEKLPGKVYTVSLHREWLTNPDFIAERNKVHPLQ